MKEYQREGTKITKNTKGRQGSDKKKTKGDQKKKCDNKKETMRNNKKIKESRP